MTRGIAIEHSGRTISGGFVAFDIRWQGEIPADADVQWAMVVSDGEEEVSLVHTRSGGPGGTAGQYVVGGAGREDVEPDADVSDDEVTVRFPAGIVGVAAEWPSWTAVLTINGEDVSRQAVPVG